MNLSLCVLLCNFLVLSTFIVVTGENVNMKKNVPKKGPKDEIFIDDEDMDNGSGNGEDKDDVESSGSGFGPDDEDTRSGFSVPKGNVELTVQQKGGNKEEPILPMPPPKVPPPALPPQTDPTTIFNSIDMFTKSIPVDSTNGKSPEEKHPIDTFPNNDKTSEDNRGETSVYITNNHDRDRTTSFFAQPGILAAVIGGAVVGLLCAILVVMFIVYRMRKKDEGSYALEEMKRCPATNPYMKPNHREFFA